MIHPTIPYVMHQVLRIVRNSFQKYWNFSIYCLPLDCSVNCTGVSPCHLKDMIFKPYRRWSLSELRIFFFNHQIFIIAVRDRRRNCSTFTWTNVALITCRACHSDMVARLTTDARVTDALAQICFDAQQGVRLVAQQRRTSFRSKISVCV